MDLREERSLVAPEWASEDQSSSRVREAARSGVEQMVAAARVLSPADAAFIRALFDRGMTVPELARALECTSRAVHRRLARLMQRMSRPEFRYALRMYARWPAVRRAVAEAVIFRGEGIMATARALNLSGHRVRTELAAIRTLAAAANEFGQRW